MLTFEEKLAKYAELLIGLGVNLQKGQYLLLDIDAENYPLARALSHEAFQRGAKDVIIHWAEPYVDRERALSDTQEDFSAVAPWETESYAAYIQQGACSLRILPAYPTLFEGADPPARCQRAAARQQHAQHSPQGDGRKWDALVHFYRAVGKLGKVSFPGAERVGWRGKIVGRAIQRLPH